MRKKHATKGYVESLTPEIIMLYVEKRYSMAEIGVMTDLSSQTIFKVLKRNGIKARHVGNNQGKDCPNYIHGRDVTLYANQIEYRDLVDNTVCSKCGKIEGKICAHHKNGDNGDNTVTNMAVLCSVCHASLHQKEDMEYYLKHFKMKGLYSLSDIAGIFDVSPGSIIRWKKQGLPDSVKKWKRYTLYDKKAVMSWYRKWACVEAS